MKRFHASFRSLPFVIHGVRPVRIPVIANLYTFLLPPSSYSHSMDTSIFPQPNFCPPLPSVSTYEVSSPPDDLPVKPLTLLSDNIRRFQTVRNGSKTSRRLYRQNRQKI